MWAGKGAECPECQSVLVDEVPNKKELEEFYSSFNTTYKGGGNNLDRYAKVYLSIVRKLQSTGLILDIGPSNSPFANYATLSGYQVTAIDYSLPDDLSKAVKFVQGNLGENLAEKLGSNKFDVVCAWAVIEHCSDPVFAIESMVNLVKGGGYIILTTPEIGTQFTNYSIGKSKWFYPPEHLFLISPKAMSKLFEKYNCKSVILSRIELNMLRLIARSSIGFIEMLFGLPMYFFLPNLWLSLRERRYQKYAGISLFVYKKL